MCNTETLDSDLADLAQSKSRSLKGDHSKRLMKKLEFRTLIIEKKSLNLTEVAIYITHESY